MSYQQNKEQLYLREDIHELAINIQLNRHNIKNLKNQQQYLKKRKHFKKQPQRLLYKRVSKLRTNPFISNKGSIMRSTQAFDRIMSHQKNRNSMVQHLTTQYSQTKPVHKSYGSRIQTKQSLPQQNSFNKLYHQFNKGKLTDKNIQLWLNSILLEHCSQQKTSFNVDIAALKQFQIDPNSLLSKGIKEKDLSRVYNCLFVYSIGFNSVLKGLCQNNIESVKGLWKVYAILLQYCAAGSFQMIIAQIERDKVRKIQEYKQEIHNKQQIINYNDELNQKKNIKIFKEIQDLRQTNFNLLNQREVLEDDYKETQLAFNQQVILRLKFQNKINQLYGVHRQLGFKHNQLYEQFLQKQTQKTRISLTYDQLVNITIGLRSQLKQYTQKLTNLKIKHQFLQEKFRQVQNQRNKIRDEIILIKHNNESLTGDIEQKQRRFLQLQSQNENLRVMLSLRVSSSKQTAKEYEITLQQNQKLYQVTTNQRNELEEYIEEKKQYNNRTMGIITENSLLKKKIESLSQQNLSLQKKIKQLQNFKEQSQLKLEIQSQKNQNYLNDLQVNYQAIQKMRKNNINLQNQLDYLRKKQTTIDGIVKDKDLQIKRLQQKVQQYFAKNLDLNQKYKIAEMKKSDIETWAVAEKNLYQKTHEKILLQYEEMKQNQSSKFAVLEAQRLQNERLRQNIYQINQSFKNEKFERHHLDVKCTQILQVLESKNIEVKDLSIDVSQLREQLSSFTKLSRLQILHLKQQNKSLMEELRVAKRNSIQQNEQILKKKQYYHPLIIQDLVHNFERLLLKLERSENAFNLLKDLHSRTTNELKMQNLKIISKYECIITNKQQQYVKKNHEKQAQIEYERQRVEKLQQQFKKSEQLVDIYNKKILYLEQKNNEAQYAIKIEQFKDKINDLISQLDVSYDQNTLIKKQLSLLMGENQMLIHKIKRYQNFSDYQIEKGNNYLSSKNNLSPYNQKSSEELQQAIIQLKKQNQALKQQIEKAQANVNIIIQKTIQERIIGIRKQIQESDFKISHSLGKIINNGLKMSLARKGRTLYNDKNADIGHKIKNAYEFYSRKK